MKKFIARLRLGLVLSSIVAVPVLISAIAYPPTPSGETPFGIIGEWTDHLRSFVSGDKTTNIVTITGQIKQVDGNEGVGKVLTSDSDGLATWQDAAGGGATASATAPTSPTTGDQWVDTSTTPPTLKVYDGTNWVPIGGNNSAESVQTDTDPATNLTGATTGDVAYDTTDQELQVFDGTNWVPMVPIGYLSEEIIPQKVYKPIVILLPT